MSSLTVHSLRSMLLAGALLALAGCSSSNQQAGFDSTTGKHTATWYVDHRAAFLKNGDACTPCHGSDLHGGISRVSCFTADFAGLSCHANGPSGHPAGWAVPDSHGKRAKSAPDAASTSGFSSCQICHGNDFGGGLSLSTCLNTTGCHGTGINAPHSPKPWRGGLRTHTDTDTANAPACALCHTNGALSPIKPSTYDAAAAPGCFNNTLCHGTVGHPAGWALPAAHGATAKAAPAATSGFTYCQSCHGTDFAGGVSLATCLNTAGCHGAGVNAPHAFPWKPGSTYLHSSTDPGNAATCALCHLGNRNPPSYAVVPAGTTPGCFNNTLCHGVEGHAPGWALPTAHGANAKAAPSSSAGFSSCQSCHGADFAGGTSLQTCMNAAGCHGAGVNAPHSAAWLTGNTYVHTNTDSGNAPVCGLCHLGNRQPPSYVTLPTGTTLGCYNNTLCHGIEGHAPGWELPAQHGAHAKAGPDAASVSGYSVCQSCHGADLLGGESKQSCVNCHQKTGATGTPPHAAAPWTGSTAGYTHINTNIANAVACANCHLKSGSASAATCFNNALCHAVPATCQYCHASPPTGSVAPNRSGAHAAHYAGNISLPDGCATCHYNAGIGTVKHANGTIDVSFPSTYNAQSGAGSYNASAHTCSNISCHGGQTTPSWLAGTINVNSQCTSCHAYNVAQYNTFKSGAHNLHVNDQGFACIDCHDTSKLASVHFNDLNTPAMLQSAQTVTNVYNTSGKYCAFTCHMQGANEPHDSGMIW